MSYLFTYGTFKRGYGLNPVLANSGAKFIGEDTTQEEFLMIDLGYYPGVVRRNDLDWFIPDWFEVPWGPIHGELWEVPDDLWPALDHIEGVPELFYRSVVKLNIYNNINNNNNNNNNNIYIYIYNTKNRINNYINSIIKDGKFV